MRISLGLNMKMPTIVGTLIFIIVGTFIFISTENFMLSRIEHEKSFATSGPEGTEGL